MILARCLHDHYELTRAELQRFFGLNLARMGVDFSPLHAACCLRGLPLGSRLLAALNPAMGWTVTDYKLHEIAQLIAGQEIPYPWEEAAKRSTSPGLPAFDVMDADDFDKLRNSKLKRG